MYRAPKWLVTLLMAGVLAGPVVISGCAEHTRVYDPYYHDYHDWDHNEVGYYQRWETETRREHREFDKRSAEEQKEYWDWRHKQN
ncbi:MAG TPA: hypothetical protein VEJ67_17220 [Candidatus Cybelea sp.]|nr:hypothetical protein [Candidatus Cybelea sp.]